jgi:hypothetical protein
VHHVLPQTLTARETCQVLRDIALGVRTLRRVGGRPLADTRQGPLTVTANGWVIVLCHNGDDLDYCDRCHSPDGRAYVFDTSQGYGTNPIELLSTWERAQLHTLLDRVQDGQ